MIGQQTSQRGPPEVPADLKIIRLECSFLPPAMPVRHEPASVSPYRDGNIFCAKFSGDAAWERHPSGDELVQVVDGGTILHVITEEGPLSYALNAGMVVVVPQNMWHRFYAPDGVTLVTATPKPTEHLTVGVEDPRTLTDAQRAAATEHK